MKSSKDFDVNQYVGDGSRIGHEAPASGDTPQGEQSEQNAQNTQIGQPKSTQLTDNTASTVSRNRTAPSGQTVQTRRGIPTQSTQRTEPTPQTGQAQSTQYDQQTQPTQPAQQRTSTRQRKATLEEYRAAFMNPPKIIDRQPVFVSREVRDRIDGVVRRFGERKMSVSGFLENLARHHLEDYADDLEQWRRL